MDSKSSRSGVKTRSVPHSSNADNIATTSNMADHVNNLRESSDDMPDTPTMQLSKQIQELSKEIKKLHDLPERMAQLESKISHDNAAVAYRGGAEGAPAQLVGANFKSRGEFQPSKSSIYAMGPALPMH